MTTENERHEPVIVADSTQVRLSIRDWVALLVVTVTATLWLTSTVQTAKSEVQGQILAAEAKWSERMVQIGQEFDSRLLSTVRELKATFSPGAQTADVLRRHDEEILMLRKKIDELIAGKRNP